jgi:creatinine amidohydrolase/Fe(II)-dependent formamide hydrolase-like protein
MRFPGTVTLTPEAFLGVVRGVAHDTPIPGYGRLLTLE